MAAKYKKRTPEEIKAEVDKFSNQIITSAREYTQSPKDVMEFLDFMARFPNYSLRNQVLVRSQYEGAQAVASYNRFKDLGTPVRTGEKAIKIFAPKTVKTIQDENGNWLTQQEATTAQKAKAKSGELKERDKIIGWKMVSVFDATQTSMTAEDYPKIYPNRPIVHEVDPELNKVLINALDDFSKSRGALISETSGRVDGAALGAFRTFPDGKQDIVIDGTLPESQKVAVRIHEIGHSLMHADPETRNWDPAFKELQAEMVSHVVAKHFGMDTTEASAPYISSWTNHLAKLDEEAFTKEFAILDKANRTARKVIEAVDPTIQEYLVKDRGVDVTSPAEQEEKSTAKTVSFGEKEVERAKQVDLVDFAQAKGIELTKDSSRTYRGVEHDSLVVDRNKNYFKWNSTGIAGNTIVFAETFVVDQSLSDKDKFKVAVLMLNDPELKEMDHVQFAEIKFDPTKDMLKDGDLKKDAVNMKRGLKYLEEVRGIDSGIVQTLRDKGSLKINSQGNAVFLWRDPETNKLVGASEQGTKIDYGEYEKRGTLKHIAAGSKSGYGFQYTNGQPEHLRYFESEVDMLSYISLKGEETNTRYFTGDGLKENVVMQQYAIAAKQLGHVPESLSLNVDNDKAGQSFADRIIEQRTKMPGLVKDVPEPWMGKDWNDALKYSRANYSGENLQRDFPQLYADMKRQLDGKQEAGPSMRERRLQAARQQGLER